MNTTQGQAVPPLREEVDVRESAAWGAVRSQRGNLPLRRLAIRCQVDQLASQTVVQQVFHNCHDEFLEATYIFPLPGHCAVTACEMRFQNRVVRAQLKERGEARAEYRRAVAEGRRASIAEEERSETFSLRVGNIPPGETVTVELTLHGAVPVVDGEATLRFPLVVAPRYVPGVPLDGPGVGDGVALDTDQAPDASRISPPTLLPGMPNPVELELEVALDPGQLAAGESWRGSVRSSLHSVFVDDGERCVVRLLPGERVNRDFILRFPVLHSTIRTSGVSSLDGDGGRTVAVTIAPPVREQLPPAPPKDVCVVLDRSGSMGGWKIVAARRAAGRLIDSLGDEDRFRLLAFDNVIETFDTDGPLWQAAGDQQRWRATEWLARVDARGGTELGGALIEAIDGFRAAGSPQRAPIVVVITDGQVANEDGILRSVAKLKLPVTPRIYTVGIDRAVNAGLLRRLAELGGGAMELVESEQRLDEVMDRFHRELGAPLLTEISIAPVDDPWTESPAPERTPDLFRDRPVTVYGRVDAETSKPLWLRITARDGAGNPWQDEVCVKHGGRSLLPLWGRARVRDLEDRFAAAGATGDPRLRQQIVDTSLASGVLCRFTALVAVDTEEVVNADGRTHQVVQSVEAPDGWDLATSTPRGYRGLRAPMFSFQPYEDLSGESVDSMLQEFTDTAISFTESEDDCGGGVVKELGDFEVRDPEPSSRSPSQPPSPVVQLSGRILADAVQLGASHILLQPQGPEAVIHYVIQGRLQSRDAVSLRLVPPLLTRWAVMANLESLDRSLLRAGVIDLADGAATSAVRLYLIPSDAGPFALLRLTNVANQLDGGALPDPLAELLAAAACCREQSPEIADQLQSDLLR